MIRNLSIPELRTGPPKFAPYSGKGDFLTVVAPTTVSALATPFGATVNGEYVFASQKPEGITPGSGRLLGKLRLRGSPTISLFSKEPKSASTILSCAAREAILASVRPWNKNRITGRIVGRETEER